MLLSMGQRRRYIATDKTCISRCHEAYLLSHTVFFCHVFVCLHGPADMFYRDVSCHFGCPVPLYHLNKAINTRLAFAFLFDKCYVRQELSMFLFSPLPRLYIHWNTPSFSLFWLD